MNLTCMYMQVILAKKATSFHFQDSEKTILYLEKDAKSPGEIEKHAEIFADIGGFHDNNCRMKRNGFRFSCQPAEYCIYTFKWDIRPNKHCRMNDNVKAIPQQLHLAYASESGMSIMWTTYTRLEDSFVWFGLTKNDLQISESVTQIRNYYQDKLYTSFHYVVTLRNLKTSTKYFYQVGSKNGKKSTIQSFITGKRFDDSSVHEVAIFGDLGNKNQQNSMNYLNSISKHVDFVWHIGDIGYADNAFLSFRNALSFGYERVYNSWMNKLAPIMRRVPYMVLVGNHEAECHSPACQISSSKREQLGNYAAYNARFQMPSTESKGKKNMWYSFNHGPIHYVAISTETDYKNAPTNKWTLGGPQHGQFGDQLAWLEEDLKKAHFERSIRPWIVVSGHRPMYSLKEVDRSGSIYGNSKNIQDAFEELLLKYKVDVVFVGHRHSYERQTPISKSKAILTGVSADKATYSKPQAPVHIVAGAAGNSEAHQQYPHFNKKPEWNVMMNNKDYGIGKLKVSRNMLEWNFYSSKSGEVLDHLVVLK